MANCCFAQNWINVTSDYIKNPSFESYDECVANVSNLNSCSGWYAPSTGTSDWFDTCMNSAFPSFGTAVPFTFGIGYQYPFHGAGFVGLFTNDLTFNYREYVETELLKTLKPNAMYRLSNRICLSNFYCGGITRCVGAYFHNIQFNYTGWAPIVEIPQICSPAYPEDSVNWMLSTGIFQAVGNEHYLTLGNFADSSDVEGTIAYCDTSLQYPSAVTYYYLDSLVLEMQFFNNITMPNVMTPNNDGINDEIAFTNIEGIQSFNFTVYNRWGNLVYWSDDFQQSFEGNDNAGKTLSDGVYYYIVRAIYEDKHEQHLKGFIQLIR